MMEQDVVFKKVSFGGFDKSDVMDYIAGITDEFQNYKRQIEKENLDLKKKNEDLSHEIQLLEIEKEKLEKENSLLKAEIEKTAEKVREDENTPHSAENLKEIIESLYENINGYMEVLSETKHETVNNGNKTDNEENIIIEPADDELLKLIDKYVD